MVKNSTFIGNQNGILGATDSNGVIIIDNSRFENNGYGDGYSHGIYIGEISSLTVMNSTFLGTRVGHHIKSRAATTIIQNNTLDDNNATTSYSIDLPNGGYATINGNTLNGSRYGNNLLSVMNNTFRNNRSSSVGIYNHSQITATITNNIFENVSTQTI
jgi:hypothetical protein